MWSDSASAAPLAFVRRSRAKARSFRSGGRSGSEAEVPIGRTADAPRRDAPVLLQKAEEFLRTAARAEGAGDRDAAMLASIHAAITANDAACVALLSKHSTDPDHQRAADLLETAGDRAPGAGQRAGQLRALLKQKNLVEYEARRASVAEARDALERATRFVSWARDVVGKASS